MARHAAPRLHVYSRTVTRRGTAHRRTEPIEARMRADPGEAAQMPDAVLARQGNDTKSGLAGA